MNSQFTAASFFSGIGGIDLAFSWSGFDIRFQCEIDDYCQKVLKKHAPTYWPHAKMRGDIKDVTKTDVGNVDVMFGGFPCQDISIAGKQAGVTEGNRSGLWFELLRIIGEVRPRVVLLENVANISMVGGLTVTATLAEIGYDAIWLPVRASDVGAPHRRERWFCVAYRQSQRQFKPKRSSRFAYNKKRYSQAGRSAIACEIITNGQTLSKLAHCTSKQRNGGSYNTRKRMVRKQISESGNNRRKKTLVNAEKVSSQRCKPARSIRRRPKKAVRGSGQFRIRKTASLKSRLVRVAYGVSARVDRHRGQWPSRPNEAQYSDEPPRITGRKDHRVSRIKALGNAVVPQQVLPIVQAIKSFLDKTV